MWKKETHRVKNLPLLNLFHKSLQETFIRHRTSDL
jgi:hypothetical protein